MATTAIAGTFNAFAFAGAGYIFSLLRKHNDYIKEVERHNHAMEELTKAKEKFYQEETIRSNRRRELQQEIRSARSNMQDTSKAFKMLNELNRSREPTIEDFYKPSDEMESYQLITMSLTGSALGWLAYLVF